MGRRLDGTWNGHGVTGTGTTGLVKYRSDYTQDDYREQALLFRGPRNT
jgi:hypothetical protein